VRVSRVGCVNSNKNQTTRTKQQEQHGSKMDAGQPCALRRWVVGNDSVAESSPAALLDQIKPIPCRGHAHDGFPGKLRRLRLTGTATSSHAQVALLKAVPLPDKVI